MLDVFKDKQPLFCEEIEKSITNHKISHAYLIETNNCEYSDDLIMAFIKTIFCISYHLGKENCNNCNVCNLIDSGSFSDFIIIEPEGAMIKKEQILEMKERFKTTSYQNGPRVYLVKQADKLNKYAVNSLLKFLEEPDGNIIAIFEIDNRYKILETIRSRCQVYSLINRSAMPNFDNIDQLSKIIEVLETKKEKAIAYLWEVVEKENGNKEFWYQTFFDMIFLYEDAVRQKQNLKYSHYSEIVDKICDTNDVSTIIHKIGILFDTVNNLNYNLNINMMLDKFIISFNRS